MMSLLKIEVFNRISETDRRLKLGAKTFEERWSFKKHCLIATYYQQDRFILWEECEFMGCQKSIKNISL